MWAGEELLTLKEKVGYEDIEIIVVLPFIGHDSKWPEQSKKRLKNIVFSLKNCSFYGFFRSNITSVST